MSDYELQFQAELEKAQALSLESLALEQFQRKLRQSSEEKQKESVLGQRKRQDSIDGVNPPALPPPPYQRRSSRSSQRASLSEQTAIAINSEVKSNSTSPTQEENNDLISFTSPKTKKENPEIDSFKEYIEQINRLGQKREEMSYPPNTTAPSTMPTPMGYYPTPYSYTHNNRPNFPYLLPQANYSPYPTYMYPMPYSYPGQPRPPESSRPKVPPAVPYSQTRMATPVPYVGYPPPCNIPQYNYTTTNLISRPIRPQASAVPSIYPQLNNLTISAGCSSSQNDVTEDVWGESNSSRPEFSRGISETSNVSNEANDDLGELPNLIDFGKANANNRGSVRVSVLEAFDPLLVDESGDYMVVSEYSNSSVYEEYDPLDFLYGETQMRDSSIYSSGWKDNVVYGSIGKRDAPLSSPIARTPLTATITTNKLYDSITKMRTKNYDIEHRAFLDMVIEVRGQFEHKDTMTNPGYIIASRSNGRYPPNTSIKLTVHHNNSDEPITFTCDIESTVEHVIMHIVCTMEEEIKEDMTNYMLRVWGLDAYLFPGSALSEYDYIRECLRLEKDVKLFLHDEKDCSLARTEIDDLRDRNITLEDLMPVTGATQMLSFDNLSILLETLEGELSRAVGEIRSGGSCSPSNVLQSLKAICALTGNIETLHLTNARNAFVEACNNQGNSPGVKPEIISDSRGDYVEVNVRTASACEELARCASKIRDAVRSLIHTFTRSNLVDFCLTETSYDPPTDPYKATPSNKVHDSTIICIEAVHRFVTTWTYSDYVISAVFYHGTRPLRAPSFTSVTKVETSGFYPRIVFDSLLCIEDLPTSTLPKESRLVLTIYGRSVQTDEQEKAEQKSEVKTQTDTPQAEGDVRYQHTQLGWAAIQMFNYDGMLASGSYYLPVWPSTCDKRLGPAPHLMHAPSTPHPVLHIEIPQYPHSGVCYSDGDDEASDELQISEEKRHFESLDAHTQSQLLHMIEQGAYQRMPVECREILWEKREYLVEIPGAIALVLLAATNWYGEHRKQLIKLIKRWNKPSPLNVIHLLLPCFPDEEVHSFACELINELDDDTLSRVLPQLVSALRYEPRSLTLSTLLLKRALSCPTFAHTFYWLLQHNLPNTIEPSETSEDVNDELFEADRWTPKYNLMCRALLCILGSSLAENLLSQLALVQELSEVAHGVKTCKEGQRGRTLLSGAEHLASSLRMAPKRLPISLAQQVHAIDVKSCSYFASNTLPLKINFLGRDNAVIPAMFKVGDDLRQDALVLQVIKVLDSLWLKDGLDLRMVSFRAVPTQPKKGMIEIVTEAETLRVIQTEFGLTGSFKDRPIAEWLAKHNPSELEYERARDNFTASCAGYSVATYLLGICDRHNDNIMLKKSGHLFHIDFGKFLGDAQMFGNFKRDRAPFVLTPDMAYVINGGERPSQRFHYFVEICCMAYNVARQHHQHLLDLFALMCGSGASAVAYVREALNPNLSQAEAAAAFARLIHSSLKSKFTPINFFLHNLAQLRASGDQNNSSSELLSFMPRTYSMTQEGRLLSVEVLGFEKRYDPEKHYVYALRVHRQGQTTPSTLYRTYKHFTELYQKICVHFPLAKVHSLPIGLHVGRSNVRQVAERRFNDIQAFLTSLFNLADEIAHSDLVYTFFHPLLRDQQEIAPQRVKNRIEVADQENSGSGSLKISVQYKSGLLSVLILHAQSLALTSQGLPPNPYVKVYLVPDPAKETKRKTRVLKRNSHPSFMEMYESPHLLISLVLRGYDTMANKLNLETQLES